jgi:hypothetical protein
MNCSNVRLGKLEPRHDPRTLKLAKYVDFSKLPAPPPSRLWDNGLTAFGMMANEKLGDCTCAAAGHQIQIWTANNKAEITPKDSDIIAAYSAITGYSPAKPNSDNGANELDVLNYWRQNGIGGHKIGAFASIPLTKKGMVETAINLIAALHADLAEVAA